MSDSRLAVAGSPPSHDTAWFFISETGDLLWQINCLGNCNHHLHQLSLASLRGAKSSTSFGWGKRGKVTSARWQVTLCDPIWHVISRSGVVKFTVIQYTVYFTDRHSLMCCPTHSQWSHVISITDFEYTSLCTVQYSVVTWHWVAELLLNPLIWLP